MQTKEHIQIKYDGYTFGKLRPAGVDELPELFTILRRKKKSGEGRIRKRMVIRIEK